MKNIANYIIGFGGYDLESSAVLMKDGKVISAIQEERLNRKKYCGDFPYETINYFLDNYNLDINEIFFAYPFNNDKEFYVKSALKNIYKFPLKTILDFKSFVKDLNYRINKLKKFNHDLNNVFKSKINTKKIQFFDHHKCHFASSHFSSGFNNSVGLCIDLEGDGISTSGWIFKDKELTKIMNIPYPHSLGIFYNRMTKYLGFENHDEYKVMGLAAYGKPTMVSKINKIISKTSEGYKLNLQYFNPFTSYHFNNNIFKLLGPSYSNTKKIDERMADIACSMQEVFEDIVLHLVQILKEKTSIDNLVLSGGCSLNSKNNGLLLSKNIFKNIHIPSGAGDSGVALGAAYLCQFEKDKDLVYEKIASDYLGPEYSDDQVERELILSKVNYEKIQNPAKICADFLNKKKIIGWFQGRMEYGQRGLGNRSIFADARDAGMKDKLNNSVKFREDFRPFAPLCLEEDKETFFDTSRSHIFMNFTVKVKNNKKHLVPAIVHKDGTGRLQTVNNFTNKLVYEMINEYKKLTDIPLIINTSFNLAGEPIICSPRDAINTFFNSGLDVLIINNFVVKKT